MKPIFDLFSRILVHNSSIQCCPLRGNQETKSCVCIVPGPFGKARRQFDTQSNNYTFTYVALLNSSEAARCGRCWRCSYINRTVSFWILSFP